MSTPNALAATRQALLALLRGVPAVGIVHAQERFADSDSGFKPPTSTPMPTRQPMPSGQRPTCAAGICAARARGR